MLRKALKKLRQPRTIKLTLAVIFAVFWLYMYVGKIYQLEKTVAQQSVTIRMLFLHEGQQIKKIAELEARAYLTTDMLTRYLDDDCAMHSSMTCDAWVAVRDRI